MKYLLILLAILVGAWLWRNNRRAELRDQAQTRARQATPQQLQDMVRCKVCGVHLPSSDAVRIGSGVFCCPEHAPQGTGR